MKNKIGILLSVIILLIGNNMTVFAAGETTAEYPIEFEDSLLDEATKIDEKVTRENGRITTTTTYLLDDGTKIVDTFTRGDINILRSKEGSDTATRTRDLGSWGTVTLTASFKWRTEGMFSYVECTSASASKNLKSGAATKTWDLTKTSGEVSIGSVNAKIKYAFYNTKNPMEAIDGTLKIKCTDSGSISDS